LKRLDELLLGVVFVFCGFLITRGFFAFVSDIYEERCQFNAGDTVVHIVTEEEWRVVKSIKYCRMVIVNGDKEFHEYEDEYMYKHKNSQ